MQFSTVLADLRVAPAGERKAAGGGARMPTSVVSGGRCPPEVVFSNPGQLF